MSLSTHFIAWGKGNKCNVSLISGLCKKSKSCDNSHDKHDSQVHVVLDIPQPLDSKNISNYWMM